MSVLARGDLRREAAYTEGSWVIAYADLLYAQEAVEVARIGIERPGHATFRREPARL